ncbi:MAG TPA: hypothetical protein VHB46_13375, partial [Burkholderiales bacterium]|nr:hypothetical protein [Burkholderiales bacterium]
DEDSGGELIFCSYRSAGAAVVVSIVEFPSEAAARKQLGSGLINDRMGADDAKVVEERGIGEKAFYGASAKGSMYVFLRKNKVGGVGVGGPGKAADLKDALRKAAQSVAAKL